MLTVEATTSGYAVDQLPGLYEELMRRTTAAPGATGVAVASKLPLAFGVQRMFVTVPGVAPPPDRDTHPLDYAAVSPSYFDVMGVPLRHGVLGQCWGHTMTRSRKDVGQREGRCDRIGIGVCMGQDEDLPSRQNSLPGAFEIGTR